MFVEYKSNYTKVQLFYLKNSNLTKPNVSSNLKNKVSNLFSSLDWKQITVFCSKKVKLKVTYVGLTSKILK